MATTTSNYAQRHVLFFGAAVAGNTALPSPLTGQQHHSQKKKKRIDNIGYYTQKLRWFPPHTQQPHTTLTQ
jgi:hypothetical protein